MSLDFWKRMYLVAVNPIFMLLMYKMAFSPRNCLKRILRLGKNIHLSTGIQTTGKVSNNLAVNVVVRKIW